MELIPHYREEDHAWNTSFHKLEIAKYLQFIIREINLNYQILWIECELTDENLVIQNIKNSKLNGPDYINVP